jgi:hypothetical protein
VRPSNKIGEGSIELAKRLGIENTSPIDGGAPAGTISYVIFPGSGSSQGFIPSNREIQEQGQYLIRGWRGIEGLSSNIVRDNYPEPDIRTSHKENRFDKPMWNGEQLDGCLYWADKCGQPAADQFCKQKGYSSAGNGAWGIESHAKKTRVIMTNKLCETGKNNPNCGAFTFIECK